MLVRPCIRSKGHTDPQPETCAICRGFTTGSVGTVNASRPVRQACRFLGEPTGETVPCADGCGKGVHLKVFDCAVMGRATLDSTGEGVAGKCRGCASWQAPILSDQPAKVRLDFRHGLGDACNFAHMIPLYTRRGIAVEVSCRPEEAGIFQAGGASIATHSAPAHPWGHAPMKGLPAWPDPWTRNKNAWNLSRAPLPDIGNPADLWNEYARERIDFAPFVSDADRAIVDLLLNGAGRPVIALHHRGFQWGSHRDYPDDLTVELMRLLLDRYPAATIVLIDRDKRGTHLNAARVCHFVHFQPPHLYELLRRSDVLIGIDSGPLNFVRLTDTPAVGIWKAHYPADYFLPRERTVHVVASRHNGRDRYEREHWNTILCPDDGPSPEFVARTVGRVLAGPKYLPASQIARDVQLQSYIDRTDSDFRSDFGHRVDRHESFGRVLAFLAGRPNPTIIETGTIRSQEDWAGAGFSTYLLGAFLARHGGHLHSVDLMPNYAAFAREWTREFPVTVHDGHSHQFLEAWSGPPIDLFYSDSHDTDVPGHQECCLGEMKRAMPHLAPGAMILIDDTPPAPGGGWRGKGGQAVPWLIGQGWRVEWSGWQALLRSPAPSP